MIRGVDRETRKSIKDAARAEGISVGTWVRRCLLRTLKATADGPATLMDLREQMRIWRRGWASLKSRTGRCSRKFMRRHPDRAVRERRTDKMASHQEIEVKLRADPEKIAKIRRSRWWRELERLHRQSLHSIYYDTSDHQLRDSKISLRTRTDGHSFVRR